MIQSNTNEINEPKIVYNVMKISLKYIDNNRYLLSFKRLF